MHSSITSSDDLFCIGKIGKSIGFRGWCLIHSFTDPPDSIFSYPTWLTQSGQTLLVAKSKSESSGKLKALVFLNEKPLNVHTTLWAPLSDRKPPQEGSYFWSDIQGSSVVNTKGIIFGKVDYLFDNGMTIMVIKPSKESIDKRQRMIPFSHDRGFVITCNIASKTIVVNWDQEW